MCAYMQASDLLISKAGGLTTAEAVASRTPLLYLNAVPGCESRNIDFMTGRGYALAVESDEELKPLLSGVISGAIDPRPCCAAGRRSSPATPPQPSATWPAAHPQHNIKESRLLSQPGFLCSHFRVQP